MNLRTQRLLLLFGLCATFGTAVWTLNTNSSNPHSLLAGVNEPAAALPPPLTSPSKLSETTSPEPPEEGKIDQPPPDSCGKREVVSADKGGGTKVESSSVHSSKCEQIIILVGGTCKKFFQCRYRNPGISDETFCAFTNTDCPTTMPEGVTAASGEGTDQQFNLANPTVVGTLDTEQPLQGSESLSGAFSQPPTPTTPPTASSPAATPAAQIGNIAISGSGYPPSGSGNVPNSTFTPSPQLSGSPFNLGSLFGCAGPSGGGAGGYPGGTVAYAPQGDPGYYNRNFESVDAQITFPKAQPSPGDILARLAQNTKRTGEKVTIGGPEDGGIIDSFVRTILNNVVTPVGDFVRSAFSSEDTFQPSGGGTADASFVERQNLPPLERGRLVLTLSADDSLVPGDPTSIANIIEWEARESIPASNRAWVENAPRASDVIEDIGSAPLSYGWGEAPQIGGDAEVEAPQVSDVSYNPFLLPGGSIPEIGEDEGASEPPRSFFSVMAKSFGTIAEAVRSLFANIGKALFWWL